MTVAEAATAGKTAEYNALVNSYAKPKSEVSVISTNTGKDAIKTATSEHQADMTKIGEANANAPKYDQTGGYTFEEAQKLGIDIRYPNCQCLFPE
jgi:hypothetical protein